MEHRGIQDQGSRATGNLTSSSNIAESLPSSLLSLCWTIIFHRLNTLHGSIWCFPGQRLTTLSFTKYSTLLELQIVDPSGVLKGQLIPPLSFCEWGPGARKRKQFPSGSAEEVGGRAQTDM